MLLDDQVLDDFLVEAGEILDGLGDLLLGLEQSPEDQELLNAVFRGFHTIKGGAGFLSLDPMVEICHRAEDIFNLLRQGEMKANPVLMDVVLQAVDAVKRQFQELRAGQGLASAPQELLMLLEAFSVVSAPAAAPVSDPAQDKHLDFEADAGGHRDAGDLARTAERQEASVFEATDTVGGEMTEDEFERLLDSLHGQVQTPGQPGTAPSDATPDRQGSAPGQARTASGAAPAVQSAGAATQPVAEATLRVETARLDQMMNMVGELVLVRNRLSNLKDGFANDALSGAIASLEVVTSDLQAAVMKTRMQPIRKVFGRFPRVVRDLARNLNKEVVLEMHGEDTDLDKNLVDALADPLVHLVRNAVDHGIEDPDTRARLGKPRAGTIVLSAAQEGDQILLTIGDDGAGMDPGVLRRKAVERGLLEPDAASRLSDEEIGRVIFRPGFSTKGDISDISGRGVGMDVVKTRIDQLSGSVDIQSRPGEGTTISIRLPLTLAILPALMVQIARRTFALPLSSVGEIITLAGSARASVDGKPCLILRDKPIPLLDFRRWLGKASQEISDTDAEQVAVVNIGDQKVGLLVDRVLGQEEVVIKPLGVLLHGTRGFAGATVTGNGGVALIFDVPGLVDRLTDQDFMVAGMEGHRAEYALRPAVEAGSRCRA